MGRTLLLLLVTVVNIINIYGYTSISHTYKLGFTHAHKATHLQATANTDDDSLVDIEYGDFLDLNKLLSTSDMKGSTKKEEKEKETIKENRIKLALQELSIQQPMIKLDNGDVVPKPARKAVLKREAKYGKDHKRNWPNWDNFMESEFGDLDAPLESSQEWMLDARNVIEQKRGFSIWSKKSSKELQNEVKKAVASKMMNIPLNVGMIIKSVYLDRTHTLKGIRKENELAAIEYRKWIIEQKGKSKKDPIPLAKVEVSKEWLKTHPNAATATRSTNVRALIPRDQGLPIIKTKEEAICAKGNIIMDEYTTPIPGTSFSGGSALGSSSTGTSTSEPADEKKSSSDMKTTSSSSSSSGSSKGSNVLVTSSMVNWELSKEEMPLIPQPKTPSSGRGNGNDSSNIEDMQFEIEGEEMYIASQMSGSDFFVVL